MTTIKAVFDPDEPGYRFPPFLPFIGRHLAPDEKQAVNERAHPKAVRMSIVWRMDGQPTGVRGGRQWKPF